MTTDHGFSSEGFEFSQDNEAVQATLLQAAINGDIAARHGLPPLLSAFEEPYRTVAAIVCDKLANNEFFDRNTIATSLSKHPFKLDLNGKVQTVTANEVINLVFATSVQPKAEQVEAYLQELQTRYGEKMRTEAKENAVNLAHRFGDNPDQLLAEFEKLANDARRNGGTGRIKHPTELDEVIPYFQQLAERQRGTQFLGLNSGFDHVNNLCNGLDTGVIVVAAAPSIGKTTLLWQIACKVAELNSVPAIFVSMEQSKEELRAKVIGRLSKLDCRHILRGGLRVDDPNNWPKIEEAARKYGAIGRYLTILEGDESTTIDEIQRAALDSMAATKAHRCVIIIDYLQVMPLRPEEAGLVTSARDRIDRQMTALRRLARKLQSPIMVVSSENRAGYNSKGMDVFKESGGIEYAADIAMVLKPSDHQGSIARTEYRNLNLYIIKNRNGEKGMVTFKFYAKRAEFMEMGKEALPDDLL